MAVRWLGVGMRSVTARRGLDQHLARSIIAIREQSGVTSPNGDRIIRGLILVGRNSTRSLRWCIKFGIERFTTNIDAALQSRDDEAFLTPARRKGAPTC
jgi:hypothetical protein